MLSIRGFIFKSGRNLVNDVDRTWLLESIKALFVLDSVGIANYLPPLRFEISDKESLIVSHDIQCTSAFGKHTNPENNGRRPTGKYM